GVRSARARAAPALRRAGPRLRAARLRGRPALRGIRGDGDRGGGYGGGHDAGGGGDQLRDGGALQCLTAATAGASSPSWPTRARRWRAAAWTRSPSSTATATSTRRRR